MDVQHLSIPSDLPWLKGCCQRCWVPLEATQQAQLGLLSGDFAELHPQLNLRSPFSRPYSQEGHPASCKFGMHAARLHREAGRAASCTTSALRTTHQLRNGLISKLWTGWGEGGEASPRENWWVRKAASSSGLSTEGARDAGPGRARAGWGRAIAERRLGERRVPAAWPGLGGIRRAALPAALRRVPAPSGESRAASSPLPALPFPPRPGRRRCLIARRMTPRNSETAPKRADAVGRGLTGHPERRRQRLARRPQCKRRRPRPRGGGWGLEAASWELGGRGTRRPGGDARWCPLKYYCFIPTGISLSFSPLMPSI